MSRYSVVHVAEKVAEVHIFPKNLGILMIINNKWMSLPCSYLKDALFYLFVFYIVASCSDIHIVTRKL